MNAITKPLFVFLLALLAASANAGTVKIFPSYALTARDAENQWQPGVGVRGYVPLISTNAGVVEASKRFFRCQKITAVNDRFVEVFSVKEVPNDRNLVLEVELKSSIPLPAPFALITYIPEGKKNINSRLSPMDNLTGQVQTVRLRFVKNGVPESGWNLHFYQAGMELYEVNRTDMEDASPEQAFGLGLARHLSRVGSGDANPAPFFMPVGKPADELMPPGDDSFTVRVKAEIDESGEITEYSFNDVINPNLEAHLSASIDQWLFFPRIKGGQPIQQTVVIPLKLR